MKLPPVFFRLSLAGAAIGTAMLTAALAAYMVYPAYIEHAEAALSATAWRMLQGIPAYHSLDSADRTTNLYGPVTYLWHAWPLALFGASIPASKVAGVLAAALLPLVIALDHRRLGLAAPAAAMATLGTVAFLNFPVTIRPDCLLAVLVALTVAAIRRGETAPGWGPTIVFGICAGLAVNLKIYALIYFAPLALLHLWGNWRRLPVVAAVAAVVAAAPFAMPLFPPRDFFAWFPLMAGKENALAALRDVANHLAVALLPPIVVWAAGRAAWGRAGGGVRAYLCAHAACVLLVLYPATKPGAGFHYFLPFLATSIDLTMRGLAAGGAERRQRIAVLAGVALILGLAYQPERRFFKILDWAEARAATTEIAAVLKDHPGETVEMGIGGNDPLNFRWYSWRNLLVYAGNPYTIDISVMMEMTRLKLPMPAETIARIRNCHTRLWLIPKGETPFKLIGYYNQIVVGDDFREAFMAAYERAESRAVYDVWRCRHV
jgi:hypothetical protein